MKNFPHRWITMNMKNSSTLHRWVELKKCPTDDVCHQSEPLIARITPEAITYISAARQATPKT